VGVGEGVEVLHQLWGHQAGAGAVAGRLLELVMLLAPRVPQP
jgi:hypothetical protein